jgi:bifunctional UDP-N-acetylglucosamine pyrophosphorylase/glucosamine-1-phosphate N-acetyltransferase
MRTAAVILAAGQGTRMKSSTPKVLHTVAGTPMVAFGVEAARQVTGEPPVLVVGHGADRVRSALGDRSRYALQAEQLGTGHAVLQARELLEGQADVVLVFYADMPLIRSETLQALLHTRQAGGAAIALLSVIPDEARAIGRVIRGPGGEVLAIIEDHECTPEQKGIRELNAGFYAFDGAWVWGALARLPLSRKGEYYLTDLVALASADGRRVEAIPCEDPAEVLGINTRVDLAEAERFMRQRINTAWMLAGVTLADPATTYIDASVSIGRDTTILPGCHLVGRTTIGEGCRIGPEATIEDCEIADGCRVTLSVLESAVMEEGSNIGPFSHLRTGARLGRGAHVGNYGELKNSTLGPGGKMGHFSYLGDAQLGENVNIGAGTITCNFDGVRKHKTVIEDDVFIGSDTMLVAPVHIGQGAKTGAGSVVTHDIPAGAVAYGVPARVRSTPAPHEPGATKE